MDNIMNKSETLIVKKSGIQGSGTYALKDFKKGELIDNLSGKEISYEDLQILFESGNERVSCDPFQVYDDKYIILDYVFNCINHSCDPNAAVKGETNLIAIKNIKKEEEIFFDYSLLEWSSNDFPPYDTNKWPMVCDCGSKDCRKIIGCFSSLPNKIQKKYIESGNVPDDKIKKYYKKEAPCKRCQEAISKLK